MTRGVIVVGGGPTGLMQACELALAGVRPTVLERCAQPGDIPKANGVIGLIVALLDHRGLLDRLRAESSHLGPLPSIPFGPDLVDFSTLGADGPHAAVVPQPRLERLLDTRARE